MVANYLTSTGFMFIVLLILFAKISKDMQQEKIKRMYQILDLTVALYVLLDAGFAVGFLTGLNRIPGFQLIIFLFFIVYVITPFVWLLFVRSYVDIPHGRLFYILEKLPLVILLAMVFTSLPTGYVWRITENGDYLRGTGFQLFTTLNLFYYLETFISGIYMLHRKMYRKDPYLLQSLMLSTLPLAAILVNTYLIPLQMTYPFQPFCLVLGVLFAYLFMADRKNTLQKEAYKASLEQSLEREREATHKAIEAGKVKSIFLANMSHDIRTPINAILGFSDIIAQNPGDEACVANAIGKIKHSGVVLLNLINDVLDLTRIENDKLQLDSQPADLTNMIQQFDELFAPAVKQAALNFEVRQDLLHPYVLCDIGKLQRILVNILNNSIKFTPKGGHILLSVTEQAVSANGATYVFLVQDTGIGISQEFQEHIFEAFEQEHSTATSNGSGAGLGLSIVKRLVDLMAGTIAIDSTPGNGTSVTITLPLPCVKKEDIPCTTKEPDLQTDLSGLHILLVEDNALNREIAQQILEGKGASITWAANGQEAVDFFVRNPDGTFDIILMDVMMPVMDGLEATRQIRALHRPDASTIPIFAMTANAFYEDVQKSKEAGINEHLSKPLDYGELVKLIGEYVK